MGGDVQQLAVLLLGKVLGNVHMEGGAAVEILHEVLSVELELVDHAEALVLRVIEVGAVEVVLLGHEIAVLLIPLVVLGGEVLGRDELGVEHRIGGAVVPVGNVDGLEDRVHEVAVLGIRGDLQPEELGSLGQAVHADGQILLLHVDEAGLVDVEHIGLEEILDDLVEGNLVLVHPFGHLSDVLVDVVVVEVFLVIEVRNRIERLAGLEVHAAALLEITADGVLDKAVQVDRHHGLGAGGHGGGTHGVLVRGVVVSVFLLDHVAKAAAAGEGVGAVGDVAEEAVSLGPHLGGEVGVLLVGIVVATVGEQSHSLHREGEDIVVAFLVEPVHEMLLEPAEGLPLRGGAVRETEVAEHAVEIRLVEIADVPEHGLIAAVARRHVHRVDHLLEIVVDDLEQGALLDVVLHHVIKMLEVVVTVILADEIVQVHQELRSGHRAHELGRDAVDEVDELAAEGLEVGRGDGNAAEFLQAALQEGIHRDGDAVREARGAGLVVLVEDMRLKVLDVLVGERAAVQGLDLVLHDVAVLLDIVLLVELVAQRHDVLAGDVGVGVELGARRGVGSLDVVLDEVTFLAEVQVGVEFLDIGTGDLLVDRHQGIHHLTADLLAGDAFIDIQVVDDGHDDGVVAILTCSFVSLVDTTGKFRLVVLF